MDKKILGIVLGAMLLTLVALILVVSREAKTADGSVMPGGDYYATSTRLFPGTSLSNLTVLKSYGGTLARVTITGANTGIIRFWNATTSNVNLRTGNIASSSLLMIEIPASAAANTYDFDATFSTGILYELVSGTAPTSTIMVR